MNRLIGFSKTQLSLPVPSGYNFAALCRNYRWAKYPPFHHQAKAEKLSYVHDLGTIVCRSTTELNKSRLEVVAESERPLDREEKNLLIIQLKRIFSLGIDLKHFHKLLIKEKEFSWIAKQKLGLFLRSPSFFEDVVKMLLSANSSAAQESEMLTQFVAQLGRPLKPNSPYHAFPKPEAIVKAGVGVLRDRIKCGYRSQAIVEAAHRFVKGEFQEVEFATLPSYEVRRRLLSLRGLNGVFLRQLMLFLGRFDDLSAEGIGVHESKRIGPSLVPRSQIIQEMYRKWGQWRGLVAWIDLNDELNPGNRYIKIARN